MDNKEASDLLGFIEKSPSQYHCIDNCKKTLLEEGATEKEWGHFIEPDKFFFLSKGASLFAFSLPENLTEEIAFRIYASHSDSPCLKLKTIDEVGSAGYALMSTESYGGIFPETPVDYDLGLAGRIAVDKGDCVELVLFDSKRPIATIPSLAIHLKKKEDPTDQSRNSPEGYIQFAFFG